MLKLVSINPSSGGIEVFVDAEPNETELLFETGRAFSLAEVLKKGHHANALASEYGPFPIRRSTGEVIAVRDTTPEETAAAQAIIKSAAEQGDLVYRKKYIYTFAGY